MSARPDSEAGTPVPWLEPPPITQEQQCSIHRAACEIVAMEVAGRPAQLRDATLSGAAQQPVMGAFVTLKRQGRLRGCCGTLGRVMALLEAVRYAAVRTATEDVRLPPISLTELPFLDVDVTLLYGFQDVAARGPQRVEHVVVGKHGLQISRGNAGGLLLPSVATEHGLSAEQFLRQVCRKAGLPTTAWLEDETRLTTFEGLSVSGPMTLEQTELPPPHPLLTADQLKRLAEHCRGNIRALWQGATPSYYLQDSFDGMVSGAALRLDWGDQYDPPHISKISLRPGLPLQSTLFSLCETAANLVHRMELGSQQLQKLRVELTVLYDPAVHGGVESPDLRGLDPQQRGFLIMDEGRTAWNYDREAAADQLLQKVLAQAGLDQKSTATLMSLAIQSTSPCLSFSSIPRAQSGGASRPAAVAGTFYPADPKELAQLVDTLIEDIPPEPANWNAAMLPHAGLVYSGRIAAATLARVSVPDTVLVIGPKHTRQGVRWAVAPHETWAIPGATFPSNPELVSQLLAAIPGLEADAAAHRQEHAIEVELPLLARFAPHTRVVGIALGSANLDECLEFASGLAQVLRQLDPQPLLVISSDMNHFAPEAENRRLDELALAALDRCDPQELYQTVMEHGISMCGVLPAVIVLEALRQLGTLERAERVAYGTSGDVNGDRSRVVGYAGMVFGNG